MCILCVCVCLLQRSYIRFTELVLLIVGPLQACLFDFQYNALFFSSRVFCKTSIELPMRFHKKGEMVWQVHGSRYTLLVGRIIRLLYKRHCIKLDFYFLFSEHINWLCAAGLQRAAISCIYAICIAIQYCALAV